MKRSLTFLAVVIAAAAGGGYWYVHGKLPQREGEVTLSSLQAPVSVRYDARGVPHIQAQNEADLYRALGYVHAQDRLFQMEIIRRLARGELAEILGSKLVATDTLFRSLRIREQAELYVERQDKTSPAWLALQAYLEGVNAWQDSHPKPMEFDALGITPRPFTAQDTISIAGYMAYSFAAAFRTEPALTYIRDQLGADYLTIFDLDWNPQGALASKPALAASDWQSLQQLAQLSQQALSDAGIPQYEGSNAWAISGSRTRSGKPLLAGDPHISFAVPSVWYEAELTAPGFNLYGYHQALNPFASLGHNRDFGWSLTMFQNDDVDLIAEQLNPDNPEQVKINGQWQPLTQTREQIAVKNEAPVTITLRRSPHGPIVNTALGETAGAAPIALWWAFLETENPLLDGFYQVNRADTLDKMRAAAAKIQAPGLNLIWANARGDIGWWAAAQLPIRPEGVNPGFILDGSTPQADKLGFYPFSANPQAENPASGYIVSANFQPPASMPIPGYYNLADRGQRLNQHLADPQTKWDQQNSQALQLDTTTDYGPRTLAPLLSVLREVAEGDQQKELVEQLAAWNGDYPVDSVSATLFNQFLYELAYAALHDELGDTWFKTLISTRAIDAALPRLAADANSPWWGKQGSSEQGDRTAAVKQAWGKTLAHLRETFGNDPAGWQWGKAHTLTHNHPLGLQKPLNLLFNVGPFAAPGTHEVPNNLSAKIGPAPWPVTYGPSTRRLIDFADAGLALTINPVGQSGVLFDKHYADQAKDYIEGRYHKAQMGVIPAQSTLKLVPRD
ncbi:penicillin acylase family protein [Pseudomonas rubra]|uniref:Penicillin acylase family protein n=1 Tax=Pseudomonas rubra TaxID=2942627 RepID=A0ABT5PDB5_9PSED|nr:penicillin acylase family protein [Pseudomonas rubra]MDD1016291.1 penicillin acylase family protein [Pseudomonas rubra]MDD1041358.1 penicillin acylase family protein [Pseudomonas rubra]MDD1153341.1 penicillin acylase family protein [Pseudomonas rubra]